MAKIILMVCEVPLLIKIRKEKNVEERVQFNNYGNQGTTKKSVRWMTCCYKEPHQAESTLFTRSSLHSYS